MSEEHGISSKSADMSSKVNHFGHIEGIKVGQRFNTINELKLNKIHKNNNKYYITKEGVSSILLSPSDLDKGNTITLTINAKKNNVKAKSPHAIETFQKNLIHKKPIRVIRGDNMNNPYAPLIGYKYDGLYEIAAMNPDFEVGNTKWYVFLNRLPNQDPAWEDIPIHRNFDKFKKGLPTIQVQIERHGVVIDEIKNEDDYEDVEEDDNEERNHDSED